MTGRETALNILYDIEYNGAYSNIALKNKLPQDMTAKDRAFVTNLVYGVLQKQITLDYVIGQYSKIKPKKISKYIRLILSMGIYQLKFMDKVPESAAVNESVKLAKRYGHSASAGFVNGILRNAAKNEIKYPEDEYGYLSIKYSFPIEIVRQWTEEFGKEFCEALLKGFDGQPKLTVRPNRLKTTATELCTGLRNTELVGSVIEVSGLNVGNDPLFKAGFYSIQDRAAAYAAEALDPKPGETVIDMCAAPGGKSAYMAELMENRGRILAFDIYEHKIRLIEENAKRLGIKIIEASVADGTEQNDKLLHLADRVLCDVPCSGWGIVRRKPDIKLNKEANSNLPELQGKILKNAAGYVKPGGVLLYSTCTIMREENGEVIRGFLRENTDFSIEYEKTFYPHIDNTDGFYICRLKKAEGQHD